MVKAREALASAEKKFVAASTQQAKLASPTVKATPVAAATPTNAEAEQIIKPMMDRILYRPPA